MTNVIQCFSLARSTVRRWTNILSFTCPHRKKSQGVKTGFLDDHWSSGMLRSTSLMVLFIVVISNVDRPVWWCSIQLENKVFSVILQL
ncbi:hypothetical protein TNCV_508541 [Trichonephila clavipes]|nr:hypothetical protein TNCV_508541 [Trichonephila clavipes]